MSVFDGHHNIPALISSSGVQPSGCPMLYYMLDALLFPQPQPAPDGERSIHVQTLPFSVKGAYLTENTQPGRDSHQAFYIRYLTQTIKACYGRSPQF